MLFCVAALKVEHFISAEGDFLGNKIVNQDQCSNQKSGIVYHCIMGMDYPDDFSEKVCLE